MCLRVAGLKFGVVSSRRGFRGVWLIVGMVLAWAWPRMGVLPVGVLSGLCLSTWRGTVLSQWGFQGDVAQDRWADFWARGAELP